jgi:branched-chain amino acid transport system ATP-binding protein
VLDEPFEGLAPLLSRHLAEVIRALRDVAVLVTESDVNRMRLLTDQICTIERGEMVLEPPPGPADSLTGNAPTGDAISNVE